MRIGVPTEIKVHEYRVGLVPASVRELTLAGHEVLVQAGAGNGIGCGDADYVGAGARIVAGPAEVFAAADLVVKVKELIAMAMAAIMAMATMLTITTPTNKYLY